ncbi:MAG: type III pantothenate kinase [Ruminococcus sp.]|nr:type III pantothenate kinase [Ruminococcus sp.]
MLLVADVGNTNTKIGIFDKEELKFKLVFATDQSKTSDEIAVELYTFFQIYNIDANKIDSSIISSVVPKVTRPLKTAVKTVTGTRSLVVGPGIKTGLDIKIDHPETLGADIVAGSVASCKKYGCPNITIFMGTATAVVFNDENGAYCGGAIMPGVSISLDALTAHGALLSSVDLIAPKKTICTNTADCIRSGVVLGNAFMLDGIIDSFFEETGKECAVISTGGLSSQIIKNCKHKIINDENLILDGLRFISELNS